MKTVWTLEESWFHLRRVFCKVMGEQPQNNLWRKCKYGRLEEVKVALEAGEDPNTTGGEFNTPCLMIAVWANRNEVVALLLSCDGINVNAKNLRDCTALHFACWKGNAPILRKLLAFPGLQCNERDAWGRTPIMCLLGLHATGPECVHLMAAKAEVDLDVVYNPVSPPLLFDTQMVSG